MVFKNDLKESKKFSHGIWEYQKVLVKLAELARSHRFSDNMHVQKKLRENLDNACQP